MLDQAPVRRLSPFQIRRRYRLCQRRPFGRKDFFTVRKPIRLLNCGIGKFQHKISVGAVFISAVTKIRIRTVKDFASWHSNPVFFKSILVIECRDAGGRSVKLISKVRHTTVPDTPSVHLPFWMLFVDDKAMFMAPIPRKDSSIG